MRLPCGAASGLLTAMAFRIASLALAALAGMVVAAPIAARAQTLWSAPVYSGAEVCDAALSEWAAPAWANAASFERMEWAPYGSAERGWATYLPLFQQELGTDCPPASPVFARRLAEFQYSQGLPATGWFDTDTFRVFRGVWQERRPFIMARVRDEPCPDPPPLYQLGYLVAEEEHADRLTRLLRRDVLDAYRRMVAAARAEVAEINDDRELLQIFSGFRDPAADAARCAASGNCDGLRRAVCSPHRTGTAVDLYVGQLMDLGVDDTSPASRQHMSRGATYRWLVRNAGRFGFVPYAYEPWHWEWVSPTGGYTGPPAP